jgi:hypothetical protein
MDHCCRTLRGRFADRIGKRVGAVMAVGDDTDLHVPIISSRTI